MEENAKLDFSAPASIGRNGERLLDGSGSPFFVIGVNYVGSSDRAWDMWKDGRYDLRLIERDFVSAVGAGANTLRLFVRQPLPQEITAGKWGKLDGVIELARRLGVYLILTFADYPAGTVVELADFAGKAAAHYRDDPVILAFDLKNEPHFSDLATMRYPSTPPLQTDLLIRRYGERVSRSDAVKWGREHAPSYLTNDELYFYANALELRREFLKAEVDWVRSKRFSETIADYMRSPDGAPWKTFLDAVDDSLPMWMKPQVEAIRSADPHRLTTIGWSDAMLASLPANEMLDILSLHVYLRSYPPARPVLFEFRMKLLDALREIFPKKPLLLEEFGYSTHKMAEEWASVAESATWLHLLSSGFAGGAKWMLVDLPSGSNPEERSFGLYRVDGSPKPSVFAGAAIGAYATRSIGPVGELSLAEESDNMIYRFEAEDAGFLSGEGEIGDQALRSSVKAPSQLLAWWKRPGEMKIVSTGEGLVEVNPFKLMGVHPSATFYLFGTTSRPEQDGEILRFQAEPGQEIDLRLRYDRIDAKVEIVWPHGGAPVEKADKANITAFLFYHGSTLSVPCEFDRTVSLWAALDNEPVDLVAIGKRRTADFGGRLLPVWDFNDIDVSAAQNPLSKLYFQVRVEGGEVFSNVWVHGADARTRLPNPMEPTEVLDTPPETVDARVQIVWPHDDAPVEEADLANVTVALFAHGTVASVPVDWEPRVFLYRALNNDVGVKVGEGTKRVVKSQGLKYPVWDFNDVVVSPARDPKNKIHFWAEVEGVPTFPTFWTHGIDARTYFPEPDVPRGDCR